MKTDKEAEYEIIDSNPIKSTKNKMDTRTIQHEEEEDGGLYTTYI